MGSFRPSPRSAWLRGRRALSLRAEWSAAAVAAAAASISTNAQSRCGGLAPVEDALVLSAWFTNRARRYDLEFYEMGLVGRMSQVGSDRGPDSGSCSRGKTSLHTHARPT